MDEAHRRKIKAIKEKAEYNRQKAIDKEIIKLIREGYSRGNINAKPSTLQEQTKEYFKNKRYKGLSLNIPIKIEVNTSANNIVTEIPITPTAVYQKMPFSTKATFSIIFITTALTAFILSYLFRG